MLFDILRNRMCWN